MEPAETGRRSYRINRREALKKGVFAAGVAWTAPVLMSIRAPAYAQASPCGPVVFSDNFEQDPCANNPPSLINWSITRGVIDLTGGDCGAVPTPTRVVDLDGTCGSATIETNMNFGAGTYQVQFDLGGNQRNAESDTVQVRLGSLIENFTLPFDQPLTTYSRMATVVSPEKLIFDHLSPTDCFGILLDNVIVSMC